MTRQCTKDKFLVVDTDSAIYACCFICQKKMHFASVKGKVIYQADNKNKYNKWLKEQDVLTQACVDYDFTEELLPFSEAKVAFNGWLKELVKMAGTTRKVLLLTKGGSCFRTYRATLKKYKGNRDNLVKPKYYNQLREYIRDELKAKIYQKWEADDACCMALAAAEPKKDVTAILAAIDKDLEQQEGRHINPNKKAEGVYVVDKFTGQYSFYKQMLMGDTADNIPGLKGVGEKGAIKMLEGCESVKDLARVTWENYQKKYGDFHKYTPWWWEEKYDDPEYHDHELVEELRASRPEKERKVSVETVFRENADLLYMLRTPDDQYVCPIKLPEPWEPYPEGIVKEILGE